MWIFGENIEGHLSGATYFLTILDDSTRLTWTYLVHDKTQVSGILSCFFAYVENQFGTRIKTLRSDNGTEIIQEACAQLFLAKGVIHHKSIPGNPQQNGRVERKHRHLLETARTLRIHASLPLKFWGECLLAATYLVNLLPSSVLKWKAPYELLFGKSPDYSHLKVMGCLCYAAQKVGDKFEPRARKCLFIGYPYGQKGYKLYDLVTHKIILSRDVVFCENVFPFNPKHLLLLIQYYHS